MKTLFGSRTFATRLVAAVAVLALLGTGLAFDLPRDARLSILADDGTRIGGGHVEDDEPSSRDHES